MKKQESNKLDFTKKSIIELNEGQLMEIDGGTSPICIIAIASSVKCVGIGVASIALSYNITRDQE
ncbi:class I lanthipeptide [Lacinutrix sp. Hel_I_90]|uniref:class I lanthipeptide n=1 Tax=Lacinutrix sp. Hel_I_90 TaxID=1249999 RepID=UPI0005C9D8B5|nr:class I lanthipeptide [Lacinutrix sp. Hel_I_90]